LQAHGEGDKSAHKTNVLRLEAELNNALSELNRDQLLYNAGAISQSNYDRKRLPTQTLLQQLNEAKANLERITITGGKQLQEALPKSRVVRF
jgi:HlyD family secretion protein